MPTRTDVTVVARADDTSGNGGRKLIRHSNGDFFAVTRNASNIYVLRSTDNGQTSPWTEIYTSAISTTDITIVEVSATKIGIFYNNGSSVIYFRTMNLDGSGTVNATLETAQTALGGMSAERNGSEIYFTWAAKTAAYANSFNIRYAKGTINADGSVTWGAVEQRTVYNVSGDDCKNPSIVIRNNLPSILVEVKGGTSYLIRSLNFNGSTWSMVDVCPATTYTQSSPSAIFVPQSVNGLANGRIWVAWIGKDSTDTTHYNLRVAYSDDGGVTWSTPQKLTNGNTYSQYEPSITAYKNGDIWIVFKGTSVISPTYEQVRKIKYNGATWGSITEVTSLTSATGPNPSTLFDLTVNATEPLFIYRGVGKVGFYGTWTVTTISVPTGSIGTKSDKANLLTYSITTDGAMSQITEKVNGVTVDTKTLTSGQSTTVSLDQAEWDTVKYGKYDDVINPSIVSNSPTAWEQGTFNLPLGSPLTTSASTVRLRTKTPVTVKGDTEYKVSIVSPYEIYAIELDVNGNYINVSGYLTDGKAFRTKSNTVSLHFLIRKNVAGDILPSEITTANPSVINTEYPLNTLEITMGTEKFTYTFDKRLDANADILSAVKATQDAQATLLPAVKSKLASAITSKGGSATGADSWDTLVSALNGLNVKKHFVGTVTASSSTSTAEYISGSTLSSTARSVSFSGLPFKPTLIFFYKFNTPTTTDIAIYTENSADQYPKTMKASPSFGNGASTGGTNYHFKADTWSFSVTDTSFSLPILSGSGNVWNFIAIG
jgi:hypothetical protein